VKGTAAAAAAVDLKETWLLLLLLAPFLLITSFRFPPSPLTDKVKEEKREATNEERIGEGREHLNLTAFLSISTNRTEE
jgi:hypothetical protein